MPPGGSGSQAGPSVDGGCARRCHDCPRDARLPGARSDAANRAAPILSQLIEGNVLIHTDFAGQAEHTLGDLVAQNLVGPACDPHHR